MKKLYLYFIFFFVNYCFADNNLNTNSNLTSVYFNYHANAESNLDYDYDYEENEKIEIGYYKNKLDKVESLKEWDSPDRPDSFRDTPDPFEEFNRYVMEFNLDVLDPYLLRPLAVFYDTVLPDFIQKGLYNMANNLEEPQYIWKSLFQLRFDWSLVALLRFLGNSTLGLFGFFDIVGEYGGLQSTAKSIGSSLGYLGVPNGPYFAIPLFSPLVARDLIVNAAEITLPLLSDNIAMLYFPINYLAFWQNIIKWTIQGLYIRVQAFDYEEILELSEDNYVFTKDFYLDQLYFNVYGVPPVFEPISNEELSDQEAEFDEFDEFDLDELI